MQLNQSSNAQEIIFLTLSLWWTKEKKQEEETEEKRGREGNGRKTLEGGFKAQLRTVVTMSSVTTSFILFPPFRSFSSRSKINFTEHIVCTTMFSIIQWHYSHSTQKTFVDENVCLPIIIIILMSSDMHWR